MNHNTYKAAMRLAGARGGASRSPRKLAALARARQVRLDRIAARRAAAAPAGRPGNVCRSNPRENHAAGRERRRLTE